MTCKSQGVVLPHEESSLSNPISVKHWVLNLLILSIPFAGFIMLIVWALGAGETSKSKQNYAIANIIMMVVATLVVMISYALFFLFFFAMVTSLAQ